VLRGGAFNNNPQNVRCAVRNDINARNANNNVGFRVVLSSLTCFMVAYRRQNCPAVRFVVDFRSEVKHGGACSWPRLYVYKPGK
jgi:hypothetical protein